MVRSAESEAAGEGACATADLPSWAAARAAAIRTERRDAAENRRRILASARTLFGERGVDAVTMQEIGREAGVGQGTLYRRYAHKGVLCEALLEDSTLDLYEAIAADVETESPRAHLERLIERVIAFNEANASLLVGACGERPGAWYRSPLYVWLHGTIAALLRRAADAGEIGAIDTDATADTLLAALDIELYRFQREQRGFTPERIAAGLRRIIAGLRAPTAPS
jgi:AcrR family transcriptional regulator